MTGAIAGVSAAVLWVLVAFVMPIWVPVLLSRLSSDGGSGAFSAYITSGSILLAALVGFVLGFYWEFRRLGRSGVR